MAGSLHLEPITQRKPPVAWQGTSKIPWHEPAFSARMLREHLDQSHSRASRPLPVIQRQVEFLETRLPSGGPGRILDLGCGPGLYCKAFAERGHDCTGIDFGPASIEYARSQDNQSKYVLGDVRAAACGNGYDLVMMTFGEFNAFSPNDALALINKMRDAAWPGGTVVLEVHAEQAIRNIGTAAPSWQALTQSVFTDEPHIWLAEYFWHEDALTAITRHFVLSEGGGLDEYVNTLQGYRQHDYITLLQHNGFHRIAMADSLSGDPGFFFLMAGT